MVVASHTSMRKRRALSLDYRLSVLSRVLAAVIGGYAFATVLSILLSRLVPMPRAEAVATGMLLSFAIYAAAVLWVFAARTAYRAWSGLLLPTMLCGLASWLLR